VKSCIIKTILALALLAGVLPLSAQMIAEITGPVETEFGTYIPQPAQILPAAESCTVAPDLSNAVARERLRRGIEAGSAHSVPAL